MAKVPRSLKDQKLTRLSPERDQSATEKVPTKPSDDTRAGANRAVVEAEGDPTKPGSGSSAATDLSTVKPAGSAEGSSGRQPVSGRAVEGADISRRAEQVLGTAKADTTTDPTVDAERLLAERDPNQRAKQERDQLRDQANILDDAPGNDTGTTGIAEQGTGAVSFEPLSRDGLVLTGPGTVTFDEAVRAFEEDQFGPLPELAPLEDPVPEPELAPLARLGEVNEDLSVTVTGSDGTKVTHQQTEEGRTTTVTKPDGSSTTLHPDGSTTDTDKDGNVTGTTDAPSIPSEENRFAPHPILGDVVGETVARTAPRAGGGDGATDPADDGGVTTVGAGGAVPDAQDTLLGGDTRGGGLETGGGATSNDGLDMTGNAGALDPGPDGGDDPFGGGLEDDPFGNDQPTRDLPATDENTDTDDDEADAPFVLSEPSFVELVERLAVQAAVAQDDDAEDAD